jgi:hypothetical protein
MESVKVYYYEDGSMMLLQGDSQIALSYQQVIALLAGHPEPALGEELEDRTVMVGKIYA